MAETKTPKAQNPLESCQGPTGFIYILAFAFLFLIMFDRSLGDSISDMIGLVLVPVIGFGGKFPVLTMLFGGLITITTSTTIRHFTMDWMDLAKKQRVMNEYNKAVREATKSGNKSKVEKLQSENQDIMGMQSAMMMQQMKASVASMVIAILIFRWLYSFLWSVPQPTVTVPWNMSWQLTDYAFQEVCGSMCMAPSGGGGMPYWIFLYIAISVPIGQALMRGFKYFEFSKKLKAKGEGIFGAEPLIPSLAAEPPTEKGPSKKKKRRSKKDK
ncbi:MAG: EMC3/TMCO1 family protein [Candidatus Thermoplasmatota archaeon]|nr:EMC3/TMCO1 family protein [Candidatus Thermoplasmatota archaeon]